MHLYLGIWPPNTSTRPIQPKNFSIVRICSKISVLCIFSQKFLYCAYLLKNFCIVRICILYLPKRLAPVSALLCSRVGHQAARGSNLQKTVFRRKLLKMTNGANNSLLSMKSFTLACGNPGRRRQRRSLNPIMPIIPITPVRFSHQPGITKTPITISTTLTLTWPNSHRNPC